MVAPPFRVQTHGVTDVIDLGWNIQGFRAARGSPAFHWDSVALPVVQ